MMNHRRRPKGGLAGVGAAAGGGATALATLTIARHDGSNHLGFCTVQSTDDILADSCPHRLFTPVETPTDES